MEKKNPSSIGLKGMGASQPRHGLYQTARTPQMHRSQFADDPDMRELVQEFVQRLPVEVARLCETLQLGQFDLLKRTAHQLKGAGGGYGFMRLTELAAAVDQSLKNGAPLERIKLEINELIQYIRQIQGYNPVMEACNAANSAGH